MALWALLAYRSVSDDLVLPGFPQAVPQQIPEHGFSGPRVLPVPGSQHHGTRLLCNSVACTNRLGDTQVLTVEFVFFSLPSFGALYFCVSPQHESIFFGRFPLNSGRV